MQIITESSCTYDIASSNSGYFFASESTIRAIADAMGASVHIGAGTGTISGYNNYTAPLEGMPFVEIGDFLFTIMYRTSNYYKYLCLYNKSYGAIVNSVTFYTSSANYTLGYSNKNNIRYIACQSCVYVFCDYEDVDGVVTPCVVRKDSGATMNVYRSDRTGDSINVPTNRSIATVDYICIQELALNMRLAVFKNLYFVLVYYSSGFRTIQLNGETYEVLSSTHMCVKTS